MLIKEKLSMSSLPKDLVVIREPAPTITGLNHPTYSVHYIRVSNNDDLDELLKGKLLDDFEPSHVILKGEIIPHSGAMGSVPTKSVEAAVQLAKATLADAGSEPRRAGLAPNTPIYHASPGQPLSPV
jgi:hypothetical protein